ncbi:LOW QUALITY PROTEIN: hypothetical protein NC651_004750 [Populus alba x Populus x berolinensis]|nr:LOW QUALITY PROTEIN: hypothetical protein NC651_004750 [Populus alba x Populus x berolinensis]
MISLSALMPKNFQAARRTLDFIVDTLSILWGNTRITQSKRKLLWYAHQTSDGMPAFSSDIRKTSVLLFCFLVCVHNAGKRSVRGSMTGSTSETQEMLDVCGKHNITCDIELVKTDNINEAWDRLARNDVRYRFVIDIAGKSSNL